MKEVDMLVYCQKHSIKRVSRECLQDHHDKNWKMSMIPWSKDPPKIVINVDCLNTMCDLLDQMEGANMNNIRNQIIHYFCHKNQYTKGLIFIKRHIRKLEKYFVMESKIPQCPIFEYIHQYKILKIFAEEIVDIQRRKRQYKKLIPEVIRLNRVLCFDVVFLIKDFLI